MIRRLRWKFVLINMSVVLAIMFTLCAVLFATTRDSLRRDSLAALEQAVTLTNTNTPSLSFRIDPEQNDNETYALFGSERVQLPFFTVQTSGSSTIFVLANQFFDTYERNQSLEDVVRKIPDQIAACIAPSVELCIQILVDHGVYTIDREQFSSTYRSYLDRWKKAYEAICDQYDSIVSEQESWISIVLRAGRIAAAGSAEASASAVH